MKGMNLNRKNIRGFTLVELLVAMALSLMIAMAAIAALTLARQGFNTVDKAAELRDNGRFATLVLKRLIVQAGYFDDEYAIAKGVGGTFNTDETKAEPNIKGFNNATYNQNLVIGGSNSVPSGASGVNNSDMLVLRFQGNRRKLNDPSATSSSSAVDEAIIDCSGNPVSAPTKSSDLEVNAFYVKVSPTTKEPTLYCQRRNADGTWAPVPLIEGVENFQVLYGVDQVVPGSAPTGSTNTVPDRYLRGDQLVVPGNDSATNKNWDRVRSVRIGMVLRSAAGSAAPKDADSALNKWYPLGLGFKSTADLGSEFSPESAGRYRQVVTFTVHLRNSVL